ncbi:MAG: hypothetical protein ACLTBR_11285 [Anaerostipes sp.]|uniref:hypothetical protein n=1 Tax=Anaerostipes sp. TaxID=1872530 RepID=UPI00399239B5
MYGFYSHRQPFQINVDGEERTAFYGYLEGIYEEMEQLLKVFVGVVDTFMISYAGDQGTSLLICMPEKYHKLLIRSIRHFI